MRALTFLLSLCLLLGAVSFLFAVTPHDAAAGRGERPHGSAVTLPSTAARQHYLDAAASLDIAPVYFVDDVEDEDLEHLPAPQFSLAPRGPASYCRPSYAFLLKHPSNRFKLSPPTTGQAVDRCILQGVFRI